MSRFNHQHKLSVKAYLYRILFLIAAIALLVICMPRESKSAMNYQKGEPWENDAFIAQDSFPILKSAEQVAREQDSLRQFYEPYFRLDAAVLERQQTALRQDFFEKATGTPQYFLPHLLEKLGHVYAMGILSGETLTRVEAENPRQVRIYRGNESTARQVSQIYSEKEAYEYLVAEKDSVHYNHALLRDLDLTKYITPNLAYDATKSAQQRSEVDGRLVKTKGIVLQGQKVVDRGQIVDDEVMCILLSWEQHRKEHKLSTAELLTRFGGKVAYVSVMLILLLLYIQQFRSDYLDSLRTVLLIMALTLFFPIATYLIVMHSWASVYVLPYCVLPIMLRIFLDSRTAFTTHVIAILVSAVVLPQPFTFIVTQIVAGLVSIFSLRELSQRSELFRAAVLVTFATLITSLCMEFVRGSAQGNYGLDHWPYVPLMMAGVFSMLAYLLLIPIERIFGFTSIVTLVELQNVNNPLLRRLSEEANGTFNHSLQVANLAAEVANRVGAKAQLVRTGALYHDIGKLENAVFFTENQNGKNPHDGLPYEKSARIIIRHVEYGQKLADKYKLPKLVKDFISTHHGRSLARYFYTKRQNETPDVPVDKTLFMYPGPKPQTLEQAILMMTDSVEAASRSLPEYTEESIGALVEKIVSSQVAEGSFDECEITFRQISEAKEVLAARLRTIYHTRIQYPE